MRSPPPPAPNAHRPPGRPAGRPSEWPTAPARSAAVGLNGDAVTSHVEAVAIIEKASSSHDGELVVEYMTAEQVAASRKSAARAARAADKALAGSPMAQRALRFVAVSLLAQ